MTIPTAGLAAPLGSIATDQVERVPPVCQAIRWAYDEKSVPGLVPAGDSMQAPVVRRICVVYVARPKNGIRPFEDFVRSYQKFTAGIEHDFVVVLKGFANPPDLSAHKILIAGLGAKLLHVGDLGFDIRAYRLAAQTFENPKFCLLNSFSEILAENWLEKLDSATRHAGVGLVGATGSGESMYSNVLIERAARQKQTWSQWLWTPFRLRLCQWCFDPLPNYHLRTNGILISRELMLRVWPRLVLTKGGAYLFEHGKNSLTRRILSQGFKAVVVGRNGEIYERDQWAQSRTFRCGRQENLLVADNRTRHYDTSSSEVRKHLVNVTWGQQADAS